MTVIRSFPLVETFAGDDITISITVENIATLENSSVVFALAKYDGDQSFKGNAVITKTTGAGEIALAGNVASVTIDKADTESLKGLYYAELEVTGPIGNEGTASNFIVKIKPSLID